MGQLDLFRIPRKPWNAGRMTGAKASLKPKHIWAIRQHLKSVGSIRDLAMFNIALDAKLRGCDLVKLRLADIAQGGVFRQRSTIIQQKTGRPVPSGSKALIASMPASGPDERLRWVGRDLRSHC